MSCHFVADVHLTDAAPATWEKFFAYLAGPARKAGTLYLLGDLFHAYVGDDDRRELATRIRDELASVAAAGVALKFIFGNHDFMVGGKFAADVGMEILGEKAVIAPFGTRLLLLHGDSLITSDVKYQQARRKVYTKSYLFMARKLPMKERLRRAARMLAGKDHSNFHAGSYPVDEGFADELLAEHEAEVMIHGHTHLPGLHPQAAGGQRWVLPAWPGGGGPGGWLELDEAGFRRAGDWG